MGRDDRKTDGGDNHIDRGIKKSQKRSNRHRAMKSLQEWIDISNSDEGDLDEYIDEEGNDYE